MLTERSALKEKAEAGSGDPDKNGKEQEQFDFLNPELIG